mgnify:CR=1 FL=1
MLTPDDVRFFQQIAAEGSLAGAARMLGVTPPAITLRLQQIEKKLGVRLIDRSTRRMHLTDEGQLLRDSGRGILAQLDALGEQLSSRKGLVAGELRLRAPLGFGRRYVAPALLRFRRRHPNVVVSLALSDRPGRQYDDANDIVIHIGALPDSSRVAIKLAPNRRYLCAAPAYLKGVAPLRVPADLGRCECLVLRENDEDVTLWRFRRARVTQAVRVRAAMSSNDGSVVRDWALQAAGVLVRSEWDVAGDLRARRLVRLLPDYDMEHADIVALIAHAKGVSARVREFCAFLKAELTPTPWRTES